MKAWSQIDLNELKLTFNFILIDQEKWRPCLVSWIKYNIHTLRYDTPLNIVCIYVILLEYDILECNIQ